MQVSPSTRNPGIRLDDTKALSQTYPLHMLSEAGPSRVCRKSRLASSNGGHAGDLHGDIRSSRALGFAFAASRHAGVQSRRSTRRRPAAHTREPLRVAVDLRHLEHACYNACIAFAFKPDAWWCSI